MTTVLVTGAGALVGQGILRLLRQMRRPVRLVTADPDHRAAGHWLGDRARLIPLAKDPAFIDQVLALVVEEHVDLVFPGTDVELALLAAHAPAFRATGAEVVVCSPRAVEIADDKWLTAQFLSERGFPAPDTARSTDPAGCAGLVRRCGLPLFAKPRRGARSVGARVVRTEADLAAVLASAEEYVIQELLPDAPGEFTAGCLGARDGSVGGVVVLRRDLRDGNTFRAYWDPAYTAYDAQVAAIAQALGIWGSANFQFRVKGGRAVVFEINARCSGTTPLRAMFGFNEVEAIVEHILAGAPIPQPSLRPGAVLRTWSDLFVEGSQLDALAGTRVLDAPQATALPFITGPRP